MSFAIKFAALAAQRIEELEGQRRIHLARISDLILTIVDRKTEELISPDEAVQISALRGEIARINGRIAHFQTHSELYLHQENQKRRADEDEQRKASARIYVERKPRAPEHRGLSADEAVCRCPTCSNPYVDEPTLPVPVTIEPPIESDSHLLRDDVERRARAIERWSPWERRRRSSRRYEGFAGGLRDRRWA